MMDFQKPNGYFLQPRNVLTLDLVNYLVAMEMTLSEIAYVDSIVISRHLSAICETEGSLKIEEAIF